MSDSRIGSAYGAVEMDEELLRVLACPVCKTRVELEGNHLVCVFCSRRYPIRDGIPVMLENEAEMPHSQDAPSK